MKKHWISRRFLMEPFKHFTRWVECHALSLYATGFPTYHCTKSSTGEIRINETQLANKAHVFNYTFFIQSRALVASQDFEGLSD